MVYSFISHSEHLICMDGKTWLGTLAEMKVAAEYAKNHWNVFSQSSGKAPFDLIVCREDDLRRVQVKGTQYEVRPGKYEVQLRSTRHNMNGHTSKRFNRENCDELAIYVEPIDRVYFIKSDQVTNGTTIVIDPDRQPEWRRDAP